MCLQVAPDVVSIEQIEWVGLDLTHPTLEQIKRELKWPPI
jgi:hypothetical protein